MDIETSSIKNTESRFLVHNVGWVHSLNGVAHREDMCELVAQNVEDLVESKVMWNAFKEWKQTAERVCAAGRGRKLYVYAHNNSRFDGVAVMHAILSETSEPVRDLRISNGKYMSFEWKNLVFRDSMLIATTSHAEAAIAYVVKKKKSYLPHSYLQNVDSLEELLCRIHEFLSRIECDTL